MCLDCSFWYRILQSFGQDTQLAATRNWDVSVLARMEFHLNHFNRALVLNSSCFITVNKRYGLEYHCNGNLEYPIPGLSLQILKTNICFMADILFWIFRKLSKQVFGRISQDRQIHIVSRFSIIDFMRLAICFPEISQHSLLD